MPRRIPPEIERWKADIAERRFRVQRLYFEGNTYQQIADLENVNIKTVSGDMKALTVAWKEASLEDRKAYVAEELARIAYIEEEAIRAWTKSKNPEKSRHKKVVTGEGPRGAIDTEETTKKRTTRTGNHNYLEVALRCCDMRLRLFGLYDQDQSWRKIAESMENNVQLQEAVAKATTAELRTIAKLGTKAELPLGDLAKDLILDVKATTPDTKPKKKTAPKKTTTKKSSRGKK